MSTWLLILLFADDGSDGFPLRHLRTADVVNRSHHRGLFMFTRAISLASNRWLSDQHVGVARPSPIGTLPCLFDEVAFNQLCLKALFVGSELNLIQDWMTD